MDTNESSDRAKRHSEDYFGETRDHWWNRDYLNLVAQRLNLKEVKSMLDVGCGVGHWNRLICPLIAEDAEVTGVDREPDWIEKCRQSRFPRSSKFQVGDATQLPFADASFEMVTCQTVLMHLKDPKAALKEFWRVLKPGGLLLVAEPNILAGATVKSSLDLQRSVDERIEMLRFMMICNQGKKELGEGDNEIGDLVPGYVAELGFQNIQVSLCDRPAPMFPPYSTPAQRAAVEEAKLWKDKGQWLWSKEETLRYFRAGGGVEAEFAKCWDMSGDNYKKMLQSLEEGIFHCANGFIFYLVSGRKA